MTFKPFVTPHCHIQSLDSGSTPELFAKKELELGTGYITVTDHGTMEATRRVYDLTKTKKFNGLKPILGIEGYMRDDNCPFFQEAGVSRTPGGVYKGTYKDHFKYGHVTLHAVDEQAFGALSRGISDADLRAEVHGRERKPLFNWKNLEELGAYNITATSGCLIGMVSRHLLDHQDVQMATRYYERLRSIFKPGNFYVEVFPHKCDRNWESWVYVTDVDGNRHKFVKWKKFKTSDGEIEAEELAAAFRKSSGAASRYKAINEIKVDRVWEPLEAPILLKSVEYWEGFTQNECHPWCPDGDVQAYTNQFLIGMAKKHGDPILISDDSHFAYPDEKVVQDIRLGQLGTWKFSNSYHRLSTEETLPYLRNSLGVDDLTIETWIQNSYDWASKFRDFSFAPRNTLPVSFYPSDTLNHIKTLITKHGRMDWGQEEYVQRLKAEIKLLYGNGTIDLLPYFMVIEEVCWLYSKHGQLTGPGRGSAAGLLLTYLLGITHVDPLRYGLSMDRFLTLDRIKTGKLPDIDQDLANRDLLVDPNDWRKGWLRERFGDCVSQISTDVSMKLKSSIRDTFRALSARDGVKGEVPVHIEALCRALPDPPTGVSDRDAVFGYKDEASGVHVPGLLETNIPLKGFVLSYAREWEIIQKLLGIPRSKSRHACGYLIANEPVQNFIPLTTIGGVRCTSFNHHAVEAAGGLKMDFLRVNSLQDISGAIKMIQDRHGVPVATETGEVPGVMMAGKFVPLFRCVPFKGKWLDIYDLPTDRNVYLDICDGRVETVFQLDGAAARQGLTHFRPNGTALPLKDIDGLAAFTSLDRPGPLDALVTSANGDQHNMLVEYSHRAQGEDRVGGLPILDELIPETHGVIVYQEQLQRIFQEVGGTTAIEANNFRQRIGKKKMSDVKVIDYPVFMKGATERLGPKQAQELWSQIECFGMYGFNKSHAVSYMFTAYACAWLKHYYPLEWWCSVLQNGKRDEIDEKFWRHAGKYISLPDIRLSGKTFEIQGDKIRAPLNLLKGIGEKAHEQLMETRPYENVEDLLTKINLWREANAKPGLKKGKVDPATGQKPDVPCMKKATTALNSTIIQNLILSGAMDSMFPEKDEHGRSVDLEDRLSLYEIAAKKILSKKVTNIGTKFSLKSPLVVFQLQKKVLPAYSVPIAPLLYRGNKDRFSSNGKRISYKQESDGHRCQDWMMVTGKEYEDLTTGMVLPPGIQNIAAAAYVISDRRFTYTQKVTKEQKTACELLLDLDGSRQTLVRWPGKNGLPDNFKKPLDGCIILCLLSRNGEESSFFFTDAVLFAPSLTSQLTEEDKEESP